MLVCVAQYGNPATLLSFALVFAILMPMRPSLGMSGSHAIPDLLCFGHCGFVGNASCLGPISSSEGLLVGVSHPISFRIYHDCNESRVCYARLHGPSIMAFVSFSKPNPAFTLPQSNSFGGLEVAEFPQVVTFDDVQLDVVGKYIVWISCNFSLGPTPLLVAGPLPSEAYTPSPAYLLDWRITSQILRIDVTGQSSAHPLLVGDVNACRECNASELLNDQDSGVWVDSKLVPACARDNTTGQWFRKDPIWLPHRHCAIRFISRAEFGRRAAGLQIVLVGDSMMRGIFCDLQNWLFHKHSPSNMLGTFQYLDPLDAVGPRRKQKAAIWKRRLKDAFRQLILKQERTSWDDQVCGFHAGKSFPFVYPTSFSYNKASIRYLSVFGLINFLQHEEFVSMAAASASRPTVFILHSFLWDVDTKFAALYSYADEARKVFEFLNRSGIAKRCIWVGAFAKHNIATLSSGVYAKNQAIIRLCKEFGVRFFDVLPMTLSRPDRNMDTLHYFPRKPQRTRKVCAANVSSPAQCFFLPDLWEHSVSLTITNKLVSFILQEFT